MDDVSIKYNPNYKKENIRNLRRFLKLSQREFLEIFFKDDDGKLKISVATLSNLESKGGSSLNMVVLGLSSALAIEPCVFALEPKEFMLSIDVSLSGRTDIIPGIRVNETRANIMNLINRLTMYIADEIFAGNLKQGDKIKTDRELAKLLGVGRSAIREALKVIEVMGMIDIIPGQGIFISRREENFFVIPISWSLFLSENQVSSILQLRDILEQKSAELAASCSDKRKLAALDKAWEQTQVAFQQNDFGEFLNLDIEFHCCIANCSENQVIYSQLQTIRNLMKRVSKTGMINSDQIEQIYNEHEHIYSCIVAHDAMGAQEAMRFHISNSTSRYNFI